MATIIQVKRTTTANLPSTLEQGELAYIYDTSATDTDAGGLHSEDVRTAGSGACQAFHQEAAEGRGGNEAHESHHECNGG